MQADEPKKLGDVLGGGGASLNFHCPKCGFVLSLDSRTAAVVMPREVTCDCGEPMELKRGEDHE